MRKSFVFLITSVAVAALLAGCAQHSGAPAPKQVDIEGAKKLRMPVVIYHVGVQTSENGTSRPVVYFVNTSDKPVDLATFYVTGKTKEGNIVSLWADDYERVPPGRPSSNGVLGGAWSNTAVECIEIKQAGLHIDGVDYRFSEENINQLFQDPSINRCE